MIVNREWWNEIGKVKEFGVEPLKPERGNILSSDGNQILATSLPNWRIYVDFLAGDADKDSVARMKRDSMWMANIDTISKEMAEICQIMTVKEYKEHLQTGLDKHSRYWEVCPGHILNYNQYKKMLTLPIFREKSRNVSGISAYPYNNRDKPFGTLAKRTLGELYGAKDEARSGIELAYDSILRGKEGLHHKKKVFNKFLDIIDKEPEHGLDLVSTIDVTMQDICEKALHSKLIELDAMMGVVVLMEVETGDVKAIVNLEKGADGLFYERQNNALSALMEPGSTFKTASIMVALDDGVIKVTDHTDGNGGLYNFYGTIMKDHNWNTKGYHDLDVPHVLMYSSNIGVSRFIDEHYHNEPEKFVEGLNRIGIGAPLGLPFAGTADPKIRMPKRDSKGTFKNSTNWSATALAWMSIGYETQIPPISTVTFYNAIANNGKMVQPRFVKGTSRDGVMVEEFPVKVIREQICKPQTLKDIQTILRRVVCDKEGLGKKAGNRYFDVSGKTGTAQIAGKHGYHGGQKEHLVSFCGYFPSDAPRYTCIVAIRHAFPISSGGGQAGPVFSEISQRVYSKNLTSNKSLAADSTSVFVPDVKTGDRNAAKVVLDELNIPVQGDGNYQYASSAISGKGVCFKQVYTNESSVPDVVGMCARDAIFALENKGVNVKLKGRGVVARQSIAPGGKIVKGKVITLELN